MAQKMLYSAEESSAVKPVESCCVCDEEFSSDGELTNHLLDHANDEEFKARITLMEQKSSSVTGSQNQGNLKRNFTQRSSSPEVWEIISDESDNESSKNKNPKSSNSFQLVKGSANARSNPTNQTKPRIPAASGPPYHCFTCKLIFKDAASYKQHLLTQHKSKPYSCQICNKKFVYKGTLRQHLHKHIGEKNYECQICHKKFSMKKMLVQHAETHEAEQRQQKQRIQPRNKV